MRVSFPKSEEISDFTTTLVQANLGGDVVLYLAVSESTVSGALIQKEKSIQKPVYYVSHSMNGP